MAAFDPHRALKSLRALYVIVSHPFEDEISREVARAGRELSAAIESGDRRRAVVVAREAAEWARMMQHPISKRLELALDPDAGEQRQNGR